MSQAWRRWQHHAAEARLQHNLLDLVVFGGVGYMVWEHASACFRLWRDLTASVPCKQERRWRHLCNEFKLNLTTSELAYFGYSYLHMRAMEDAEEA